MGRPGAMDRAFLVAFALLLLLVPFVADIAAGGDVWKMQREEEVSHTWGARLRAIVFALPCVALLVPRLTIAHAASFWNINGALGLLLLKTLLLWLVLCVEFWVAFDLRVNARWGKSWDYIGGTASLDTYGGRFLSSFKQPGRVYLILKLMLFFALSGAFLSIL
jgi:hypothetical protein